MEQRINISSGAKWENLVGYSRAVRVGNWVEVTGTVATVNGQVVGIGDPEAQTRKALEIIRGVLEEAGAKLEHVVRTRMYVTDISKWEEIGKVSFDEHEAMRLENGVHFVGMGVDGENANLIHLFFGLDDIEKAKAFAESEDLKAAMEKAGVTGESTMTWLTDADEGDDSGS